MPAALFIVERDVLKLVHYCQSGKRDDIASSIPQIENDGSDCMRRFMASLEWYHSPGTCFRRFSKGVDDREPLECHHKSLMKTWNVHSTSYGHFATDDIVAQPVGLQALNRSQRKDTVLNLWFNTSLTSCSKFEVGGRPIQFAISGFRQTLIWW